VPVNFTLRAALTTSDMAFDPPKLDFGNVFLGERSIIKLKVTNHSLLMQQYGFVGRGLHSSTSQLNLSRFYHKIHPKHPLTTTK